MPRRGAVRFKLTVVVPPDIDGLPSAELKQLVLKLAEENAAQKRVIEAASKGCFAEQVLSVPVVHRLRHNGEWVVCQHG